MSPSLHTRHEDVWPSVRLTLHGKDGSLLRAPPGRPAFPTVTQEPPGGRPGIQCPVPSTGQEPSCPTALGPGLRHPAHGRWHWPEVDTFERVGLSRGGGLRSVKAHGDARSGPSGSRVSAWNPSIHPLPPGVSSLALSPMGDPPSAVGKPEGLIQSGLPGPSIPRFPPTTWVWGGRALNVSSPASGWLPTALRS